MRYHTPDQKHQDLIINIKSYFDNEKNDILYDKRNIIKIIEYKNQKYVVKSFKIPHLLNQMVYRFFRDSKAKRSYENSLKLRSLSINTPKPIGYIEFPSLFRFKESFYISELFEYDFEIRAVFKDKNFYNREKILKNFIEFSFDLHNKSVYHTDYSPGNILVKQIENNYIFFIIDVNRMKFLDFNDTLRMKSLSKLTKDKNDNEFMIKHYAKISNKERNTLLAKLHKSLEKEKKYLKNKKRLKRLRK